MGCCVSRPNPSTSTSNHEPSADNPPINDTTTNTNNVESTSRTALNQPQPSSTTPPSARPNLPIRAPSPLPTSPHPTTTSKPQPWTPSRLEAEREAFFDTRVTGNSQVWNALRLVCECLRRGEVSQAQGILDAVGLNVPDGRVAVGVERVRVAAGAGGRERERERRTGGVFDETGVRYDIPAWVVVDPGDIIPDGHDAVDEEVEKEPKPSTSTSTPNSSSNPLATSEEETITLKARLSDRPLDVTVRIGRSQTAGMVCSRVRERIGPRKVRLVYLGRAWEEGSTLEELGYREGDVVSVFVFDE